MQSSVTIGRGSSSEREQQEQQPLRTIGRGRAWGPASNQQRRPGEKPKEQDLVPSTQAAMPGRGTGRGSSIERQPMSSQQPSAQMPISIGRGMLGLKVALDATRIGDGK